MEGRRLSLVEILSSSAGRRTLSVQTYWRLAASVGEYCFALSDEQFLSNLGTPQDAYHQALLTAAASMARARRHEAGLSLRSRQEQLAEQIQWATPGQLPWPAEPPLVSAYETRFERLFAGQPAPRRLHQIHRALPELQTLIDLQASAVIATSRALEAATDAYRRRQATIPDILSAHQALRAERQRFLEAVLAYNDQIAEYAMAVASGVAQPDRLASTLIRAKSRDERPARSAN
jgi:hypothetical protein